jgi:hypothetical protein
VTRIGHVPGIIEVKRQLAHLQERGLIKSWTLPHETLLTRLDAATFFLAPAEEHGLEEIWSTLGRTPGLQYQQNTDKKLSDLPWQIQFNASLTPGPEHTAR